MREGLERATESRFFVMRAVAGVALSVDAALFSVVRRRRAARRFPVRTEVAAPNLAGVLRIGMLALSAALLATGAAFAAGILQSPPS